jgi:hypothetical protein
LFAPPIGGFLGQWLLDDSLTFEKSAKLLSCGRTDPISFRYIAASHASITRAEGAELRPHRRRV